ncbi:MAG: hypothetical protein KKH41_03795 [Candidatus Thermoplasmatota archaeon]|nr:hypothetical protein [Candidatus Thermoplasmatota archaeon]MBU4072399.1 hypothetical protein [Candidatus Thermoplasmatota archaeon]MBU4144934.1 hypothetical protein [Candidatus Thermoplasmatota archaeon]MBU4591689.1 hypothetical protein [Candidatus Thermoplasmatota archaeon]
MMYRDRREYAARPFPEMHEPLKRWLSGDAGIEVLKTWLEALYASET